MKARALLALVAATGFFATATVASAATPQPQINKLKGQVSTLSARVNALTNRVGELTAQIERANSAAENANSAALTANSAVSALTSRVARDEDLMFCFFVLGNDVDVGLFNIVAALAGSSSRITTRLDDRGSCARVGITRTAYSAFGATQFDSVAGLIGADPLRALGAGIG